MPRHLSNISVVRFYYFYEVFLCSSDYYSCVIRASKFVATLPPGIIPMLSGGGGGGGCSPIISSAWMLNNKVNRMQPCRTLFPMSNSSGSPNSVLTAAFHLSRPPRDRWSDEQYRSKKSPDFLSSQVGRYDNHLTVLTQTPTIPYDLD